MNHDMSDPVIVPEFKVDIYQNCYDVSQNRAKRGEWQKIPDVSQYGGITDITRLEFEDEKDADQFVELYNQRDLSKVTWFQEILQGKQRGRMFVFYWKAKFREELYYRK